MPRGSACCSIWCSTTPAKATCSAPSSLRGLDNAAYAHAPDGSLINDTGCGNTLDFGNPAVRRLTLDTLRHFVRHAGVDGFRFDLAPILARSPGFAADAPIFAEIAADPLLADRVMIAEPWDIGPGGYQLGRFPDTWLEWNDRYRDDVRRFWRGDAGVGVLATRVAGSSDVFGQEAAAA
jgi:glycogen operon protein